MNEQANAMWSGVLSVAIGVSISAFVMSCCQDNKAATDQLHVNTIVCPDGHPCKVVDCENMWDKDCLTLIGHVCPQKYQVIQTKGDVYVVIQ